MCPPARCRLESGISCVLLEQPAVEGYSEKMPPKAKPASKTPIIAVVIFGIVAFAAAFYLSSVEPEEPPPPPPKFLGLF